MKEPPKWEYKTEFAINGRMKEVIKLTRTAAENEIATLRRKIQKLTYGS